MAFGIGTLTSDFESFVSDFKTFANDMATGFKDVSTAFKDIDSFGVNAYKTLSATDFLLPNWAWALIGIGGIIIVGAVGIQYAKGYVFKLGEESAEKEFK